METDGSSYIKFYELTRDYETTILVIKDECGYVFGGVVKESWKLSFMFYGNGVNRFLHSKMGIIHLSIIGKVSGKVQEQANINTLMTNH